MINLGHCTSLYRIKLNKLPRKLHLRCLKRMPFLKLADSHDALLQETKSAPAAISRKLISRPLNRPHNSTSIQVIPTTFILTQNGTWAINKKWGQIYLSHREAYTELQPTHRR